MDTSSVAWACVLPTTEKNLTRVDERGTHGRIGRHEQCPTLVRSWTADVLIYVVILNLFDEFSDAITIESLWISLLTAVVMKILLDAITDSSSGWGGQ